MRCQRVGVVPRGGVDVAEAGEGRGGRQGVLALHGQDELVVRSKQLTKVNNKHMMITNLVSVGGQRLLVVALAEIG